MAGDSRRGWNLYKKFDGDKNEKGGVIGRGSFGCCRLVKRVSDGLKLVVKQIVVDEMKEAERLAALNGS